jgi:hypothetical protein
MGSDPYIPFVIMRGGTSKALIFRKEDIPEDAEARDRAILAILGRADLRKAFGMGLDSLSSKVAIVSRCPSPEADVDYFFAQANLTTMRVDTSITCGNILSAVGPFAVESGLVPVTGAETTVRVRSVNTDGVSHLIVQTPGGRVCYDGDVRLDGVDEAAAPVLITYLDPAGSKTGKLLPTGRPADTFEGVPVSCVDAAVPVVFARADDLGKTGYETPEALTADRAFMARLEAVRVAAGAAMGLGDVSAGVMPKFCLVAPPRAAGCITSRYFTPTAAHSSHAVTGALCLAAACHIPGTRPASLARLASGRENRIAIEHPQGLIETDITIERTPSGIRIPRAAFVRTARLLYRSAP